MMYNLKFGKKSITDPIFAIHNIKFSFAELVKKEEDEKIEKLRAILMREQKKIEIYNHNLRLNNFVMKYRDSFINFNEKNNKLENENEKLKNEIKKYKIKDRKNKIRFCPYI